MAPTDIYDAVDSLYSSDLPWRETVTVGSRERVNIAVEAFAACPDPGATAIRIADFEAGENESYTFRELHEASNRFANYLVEHTDPQDRIGAVLPVSLELHAVLYGTILAGRIYVPVSPSLDAEGINYRLDDAGANLLVTDEESAALIDSDQQSSLESILLVGTEPVAASASSVPASSYADTSDYESEFEPADTHPHDLYAISYTSGTTGKPKGCLSTHGGFVRKTYPHVEYAVGLEPGDTYLTGDSPTVRAGRPISTHLWGATIAYYRGEFDARALLEALEEFDVTSLHVPPTGFRQLRAADANVERYEFELKSLLTGGESLDQASIEWAREKLGAPPQEGYGLTEIGMVVCNYSFDDWEIKPGSLGRPLPGVTVDVVSEDGESVEPGEIGELVVERPADVVGWYWGKPDEAVAEFGGTWYDTGDLVRMDGDGYVWYVSRKKSAIYTDGKLVPPEEVEEAILRHDAVEEVGVVGVLDGDEERVKAAITMTNGTEGGAEQRDAVRDFVRSNLPAHQRPSEIEFVSDLPKTATGKIRRTEL